MKLNQPGIVEATRRSCFAWSATGKLAQSKHQTKLLTARWRTIFVTKEPGTVKRSELTSFARSTSAIIISTSSDLQNKKEETQHINIGVALKEDADLNGYDRCLAGFYRESRGKFTNHTLHQISVNGWALLLILFTLFCKDNNYQSEQTGALPRPALRPPLLYWSLVILGGTKDEALWRCEIQYAIHLLWL